MIYDSPNMNDINSVRLSERHKDAFGAHHGFVTLEKKSSDDREHFEQWVWALALWKLTVLVARFIYVAVEDLAPRRIDSADRRQSRLRPHFQLSTLNI